MCAGGVSCRRIRSVAQTQPWSGWTALASRLAGDANQNRRRNDSSAECPPRMATGVPSRLLPCKKCPSPPFSPIATAKKRRWGAKNGVGHEIRSGSERLTLVPRWQKAPIRKAAQNVAPTEPPRSQLSHLAPEIPQSRYDRQTPAQNAFQLANWGHQIIDQTQSAASTSPGTLWTFRNRDPPKRLTRPQNAVHGIVACRQADCPFAP
ncbi:hypothetical protein TBK1r_68380 [Stieleria magnilauensis]|uniref:Uncharacterized protein n=1 Tax=Stieleria magnilauensis TaxID=2527963 RepID=A0ABX5Y1A0_9BACT|nr:hypothetical protein TBK1r_68380 [Planctomycetes bacterium TBK1r]